MMETQDSEKGGERCGEERCEAMRDNVSMWWPLCHMSPEERANDLTRLLKHSVCKEKVHLEWVYQEEI